MSFTSGFSSGNQDNEEFMQALDKVYNAPTFNRKAFQKVCCNSAKTSKIGGNDFNCTANIEKLFLECERLADIALQKSNLLNQQQIELDAMQKEEKSFNNSKATTDSLIKAQQELKDKDLEIEQLKSKLNKKEMENKALKEDKSKILKQQEAQLRKLASQVTDGGYETG